jgi:DNA-binding XRE family transcriptional regulator
MELNIIMRLQIFTTKDVRGARFVGDAEAAERIMALVKSEKGLTLFGVTDAPTVIIGSYLDDKNLPGACLRVMRKKKRKLSQGQLAALTGIARRHISDIENGRITIGKTWAKRLGLALDCDYRVFL